MLQVRNETPFVPRLFVLPDLDGIDTLYVTFKATFEITTHGVRVAERQVPIVPGDEHWGDPQQSSLRYAGEAHPSPPATEVVMLGAAYAPDGHPVSTFGVSMRVGTLQKTAQVFGDRTWKAGLWGSSPSLPVPTTQVPLLYERAYGGRHDLGDGRILSEMRNPVGMGFQGKRTAAEMNGTSVPNLVGLRAPIQSLSDHPEPVGFGYIAPAWHPRASFAGTYDEKWQKTRAPYFPKDFDLRFFQAAPSDQLYPGRLRGGEPVEIVNACPEGVQRFTLPTLEPLATVWISGQAEQPPLQLDTLLLEPDQARFSLLWRGAVACDKKALQIEESSLEVLRMDGVLP